jgi:hypothetical protein
MIGLSELADIRLSAIAGTAPRLSRSSIGALIGDARARLAAFSLIDARSVHRYLSHGYPLFYAPPHWRGSNRTLFCPLKRSESREV